MAHQARKRFGQHFLVDQSVIQAIARSIERDRAEPERWVEIGPGRAALTRALVPLCTAEQPLHAIEIDRDLIGSLRRQFANAALVVHESDVLRFDFSQLGDRLVVVGNLPYNISSVLLIQLIELRQQVLRQIFMLQKEVILRMVAKPATKDYGRLTVMLQAYYHIEHLFDVGPQSFDPPPRVDSAIVKMTPRTEPLGEFRVASRSDFEKMLTVAFSQRRKMLRVYFFDWLKERGVTEPALLGTARAEEIAVEEWIALSNQISNQINN